MILISLNVWSYPNDLWLEDMSLSAKGLYMILSSLENNVEIDTVELCEDICTPKEDFNYVLGELAKHDFVYRKRIKNKLHIFLGSERHSAKLAYKRFRALEDDILQ